MEKTGKPKEKNEINSIIFLYKQIPNSVKLPSRGSICYYNCDLGKFSWKCPLKLLLYRDVALLSWRKQPTSLIVQMKAFYFIEFFRYPIQFSSVAQSCPIVGTPWIAARQASLSITNSWSLLKLMPMESVMPSSHLILCRPLLLLSRIPPSIRVFSNESTLRMMWLNYWRFSLSISSSNEYPGLISFRMDWLDLLAVQGTLKSLLQQHSSKASIFQCSTFFTVQLSHPYMTTGITLYNIKYCPSTIHSIYYFIM